jgi:hypothetical protein
LQRTGEGAGSAEIDISKMEGVLGDVWSEIRLQFGDQSRDLRFEILDTTVKGDNGGAKAKTKVAMAEDDFWLSSLRILQWMVQRKKETPGNVSPEISVRCIKNCDKVDVFFEDRSRRIRRSLRQKLFDPFTQSSRPPLPKLIGEPTGTGAVALQPIEDVKPGLYLPLYLAKILVEVKHNGELLDQSDEVDTEPGEFSSEGKLGHRFVMRLRLVETL